jgi:hypothetical protein
VFLSLTGREPEARDWKSIDDEEARS